MGNDISEFKVRGKSSSLLKTSEYSPKPSSPHARYRERKFTRETLLEVLEHVTYYLLVGSTETTASTQSKTISLHWISSR